jgi:hypothetical protein
MKAQRLYIAVDSPLQFFQALGIHMDRLAIDKIDASKAGGGYEIFMD